jgi:hypothetical protein
MGCFITAVLNTDQQQGAQPCSTEISVDNLCICISTATVTTAAVTTAAVHVAQP